MELDIIISILTNVVVNAHMDMMVPIVSFQRNVILDLMEVLVFMAVNQLEHMVIVNASVLKDGMETAVRFRILVQLLEN
jgi:hypothetical protein